MVRFSTPTHIYICTSIYMFYSTKVTPTHLQTQILAANFHWDVVLWYSIGAHSENILAPDHLLVRKLTKIQSDEGCDCRSRVLGLKLQLTQERGDLHCYSKI